MSPKRRSSKEAELAPGSPFAPVVEAARAILRGLSASVDVEDESPEAMFLRGKIEGIESVILLCQRAGAGEAVDVPRLVKVARPVESADDDVSLRERVTKLEAQMRAALERPRSAPLTPLLALPKPERSSKAPKVAGELGSLGRCERALLQVLAQRIGHGTTAEQLAVLSRYSATSGGFAKSLGLLRSRGFVSSERGDIHITPAGKAAAGNVAPLPDGPALVQRWLTMLPKAEATILRVLVEAFPSALEHDELAARTEYSATSGGFAKAIGRLRTLRLAERGWPTKASMYLLGGGS